MRKLRLICENSLPFVSIASATMAKILAIALQPLNIAIWVLNLALLLTMIGKKDQ